MINKDLREQQETTMNKKDVMKMDNKNIPTLTLSCKPKGNKATERLVFTL